MKTQNKPDKYLTIFVAVILFAYLAIFMYLNMFQYIQHVDSDIAAEGFLAREIWNQKTLTPDSWIASTELHNFGMPLLAAVFYGITGSMVLSCGLACTILGALVIGVLFYFLKYLRFSNLAALTSILVLCALPINGIRNEGQMVPFLTLLLFLFADYYALHCILLLLSIVFYLHLTKNRLRKIDFAFWAFLFLFALGLCLGGQRLLQFMILPLCIVEIIRLYTDSDHFSRKLSFKELQPGAYLISLLAAYGLSTLYGGQKDFPLFLNASSDVIDRLFLTIPASILEGFGIAGNAKVGSLASFMQLLIWAFLFLLVYGLFYILQHKALIRENQKKALFILSVSVLVTVFIISITDAEAAHNYFMVIWFAALTCIAILIDLFAQKGSRFSLVIVLAVCFFSLLNIKYTYADALTTKDNLQPYSEVAEYLMEHDISVGYAEFWDAGRISMITDGELTMGHTYYIEDLGMYWWLTDQKWYPPNLPEEMVTAYVVRQDKKEGFTAQFTEDSCPELTFENALFAVYVGNYNYVRMP